MNINSIFQGVLPPMADNATSAAGNASSPGGMHSGMIETLLPLLGLRTLVPVYGLIGNTLGLDITWLLPLFGMAWALNKVLRQVYGTVYGFMTEHLMSNIHISSTDEIYTHLMRWLAQQPLVFNSRSLTAETISKTAWEDEDDSSVSRDRSGMYLNFANQEARAVSRIDQAHWLIQSIVLTSC
jgi:mitochondrial chaperone BCS1